MTRVLPCIFLLIAPLAAAQNLKLPLEGYYRPGAYMPVQISSMRPILIETDAAMPTRVPAIDGVVPVFVLSATADAVRCDNQSLPLRALRDDQALIGVATRDDLVAAELFPSRHLVTVDLNPANLLPGPIVAWNALDAVIADAIDPNRIAPLLAMGVTVVVRSQAKPDDAWPWQQLGDAWVLRPPGAGPRPALLGDAAYLPAYAWNPGRPLAARQVILLIAMLVSCFMLAISLWRSRWSAPAMIVLVVIVCGSVEIWRHQNSDVMTMRREDQIVGAMTLVDRWTYQTSAGGAAAKMNWSEITWPVFASPAHAAMLHAELQCDASGLPVEIDEQIPPRARLAFVTRMVEGKNF